MNKRILLLTVLTLIALMVISTPLSAAKPTVVSGEIMFAGPPTVEFRMAGNNCIGDVNVVWKFYDGDLEGYAPVHLRVISHGPCPAMPFQNQENIKASGTFIGEVDGKTGTFDFNYVGRAWPADPGELALTARIVVLSGTDELRNLRGELDVLYNMGDDFDSYSGQIHFDP